MKKYSTFVMTLAAVLSMSLSVTAPIQVQAQISTSSLCYVFTHNMGEGRSISSADATALAQALTNAGMWTSGTPITTYNDAVASAVSGFQEKYAAQILTPNGLSYGTGYVGAATRNELNSMYGGCGSPSYGSQPIQNPLTFNCPSGWICTPLTPVTTTLVTSTQPTTLAPSITSISPLSGVPGTTIIVYGSNFDQYSFIALDGPTGPAIVPGKGSATSLSFTIPTNASVGTHTIQVGEKASSLPLSNSVSFNVTGQTTSQPCPSGQTWDAGLGGCVGTATYPMQASITSVSPTSGTGGTQVTIYGNGFTPTDQVSFSQNGLQAASTVIQSATSNQIVFTLSNVLVANEPAGTYQLSVWDPQSKGGRASNSVPFTITSAPGPLMSGSGNSATILQSSLRALPNSAFTLSGYTNITSGSLTVLIVGPNYTGATDWNTASQSLKGNGSGVAATVPISSQQTTATANPNTIYTWSASFGGLATEGFYTVLIYDSSNNLLTTGQLYNGLKG